MSGRKIKLQELLSNLNNIHKLLTDDEYTTLLNNFQEWVQQRKISISALRKLHGELTDNKFQSEIGRTVSKGVGILGGITAAIGLGLALFGDEENQSTGNEMMKYGAAAGVTGGIGALSISGIQAIRNGITKDEVQALLKKDAELTEELLPFLKRSQIVNKLFEEVFDCSIGSPIGQVLFNLFNNIRCLCQAGKKSYDDISKLLSEIIKESPKQFTSKSGDPILREIEISLQNIPWTMKNLVLEFCGNLEIREIVLKICDFFNNPKISYLIEQTGNVLHLILKFTKQHMLLYLKSVAINSLLNRNAYIAVETALQVIQFVRYIVDIILNAEEVDAETEECIKMVKKADECLSNELKCVKDVYLAISKDG